METISIEDKIKRIRNGKTIGELLIAEVLSGILERVEWIENNAEWKESEE